LFTTETGNASVDTIQLQFEIQLRLFGPLYLASMSFLSCLSSSGKALGALPSCEASNQVIDARVHQGSSILLTSCNLTLCIPQPCPVIVQTPPERLANSSNAPLARYVLSLPFCPIKPNPHYPTQHPQPHDPHHQHSQSSPRGPRPQPHQASPSAPRLQGTRCSSRQL
jgi:hypothetical protein